MNFVLVFYSDCLDYIYFINNFFFDLFVYLIER